LEDDSNQYDKFEKIPDDVLVFKLDIDRDCTFKGKLKNDKPNGKGTYICQKEDQKLRFQARFEEGVQKGSG